MTMADSLTDGNVCLETPKATEAEVSVHAAEKSASSSAGSSSATSATERVSNNSATKEGGGGGTGNDGTSQSGSAPHLPESTKQPFLETIDPARSNRSLPLAPRNKGVPMAPNDLNNNNHNRSNSPRSIRENSNDGSYYNNNSNGPPPSELDPLVRSSPPRPAEGKSYPSPGGRSRRGHSRTLSDEIPRTIHGYNLQQQQQMHMQQQQMAMPPMNAMNSYQQGYYQPQQMPQPADPYFNPYQQGYYTTPQGQPMPMMRAKSERIRTYSDDFGAEQLRQSQSFGGQIPNSPTTGRSDKGGRPTLSHATSERNYGARGGGGGRRRSRHRKSHSYNAAIPGQAAGYGSFWNAPLPPPPMDDPNFVPQSPRSARSGQSGQFDRRNEIWALTSSLRSPRSTEQQSPQPPLTPIKNFTLPPPPDMRVSFSPSTPRDSAGGTGSSHGGEAVYMAQKRHKSESTRRKHIRQHSAQLFMEDIKGTPQAPACRDVVFLLLFVFHLFFIVLLGNLYAGEALKTDATGQYSISSEVKVTVYYDNLLYLSVISGAFAIGVSAMILAVMTMFARHFVQVALMVIIVLSFVWGTAGIGLSPRNVVPITGIIALALSVAYAFIVWDRIPFAAANLVTALTAIRRHASTVLVALVFQVLCLGWSIYYCIVVIGVYDAIREGKLQASHQVEVLIYVLLGVSFYWTYQVLLVSSIQVPVAFLFNVCVCVCVLHFVL